MKYESIYDMLERNNFSKYDPDIFYININPQGSEVEVEVVEIDDEGLGETVLETSLNLALRDALMWAGVPKDSL